MQSFLDFEKSVATFAVKIAELREVAGENGHHSTEIDRLQAQADAALKKLYRDLTPWQKTQVARHPDRPHALAYIHGLIDDFTPLAGDRCFGDDQAVITGLGFFRGRPVAVIGQEKGETMESRMRHNFGMARPEGYRKAARLMEMASTFGLPLIAFVDTAGAFPGVEAEERGQAEAIAASIDACLRVKTPSVAMIVGEGGSGGAIAVAATDRVLMFEHAVYTVASPEASASILWRSSQRAEDAASRMMITARDLLDFGLIDTIVSEPVGGAHRDRDAAIKSLGDALNRAIEELSGLDPEGLTANRRKKFLAFGAENRGG